MKNKARVVVIGGGVNGCAAAYNLAKLGERDVVVLERSFLASGATGRCGAGIRQQWGLPMNIELSSASMRVFEHMDELLEARRGIELKQGGYLLLAFTDKEVDQFKKNIKLQNEHGIPSRLLEPKEALAIVPFLNLEGIKACAFCQKDGHANPFLVTQAYADAAQRLGVSIETYTTVTGLEVVGGRIRAVETNKGRIECEAVIDAAGGWAQDVARMAGVELPVYSERHQILVTEPVAPMLGPMVMSFSYNIYCQQTPHGSFIMGYGDPNEPKDGNQNSSWDFMEVMAKKVTKLLPPLKGIRVVRQWAGLYNISPDKAPIVCETPQVKGLYVACGFSGHGFMIAPMVGLMLAEMILGKTPTLDLDLSLDRYQSGKLHLEPSVV
jgi:sarcosine oxidase subunit beta